MKRKYVVCVVCCACTFLVLDCTINLWSIVPGQSTQAHLFYQFFIVRPVTRSRFTQRFVQVGVLFQRKVPIHTGAAAALIIDDEHLRQILLEPIIDGTQRNIRGIVTVRILQFGGDFIQLVHKKGKRRRHGDRPQMQAGDEHER